MNYTILIFEPPEDMARRAEPDYHAPWVTYTEALQKAGVMVGGAGLQLPATATTVKLRGGKRVVQDGPFAETKEQLGGYYVINVPNLDAALDWAAKCPAAATGAIEVRPNMVMS